MRKQEGTGEIGNFVPLLYTVPPGNLRIVNGLVGRRSYSGYDFLDGYLCMVANPLT